MPYLKEYLKNREAKDFNLEVDPDTYLKIFNNSLIGLAFCSTKGEFLKVNETFCELIGYTEEELKKLTFEDITHPEDIQKNIQLDINLIEKKRTSFQLEKRYIRKDGQIVWAYLTVFMNKDSKTGEEYFVGQVQDITELKNTIKTLNDEKAKTIHAARLSGLGEMAGGMAHEINNPLQIILNSVTSLQSYVEGKIGTDEKVDDYVSKSRNSIDRMARIIRSMMNFTRTGKKSEKEEYRFSEILNEALIFCEERFSYDDVIINKSLESDPKLKCNKIEISQVLLNLFNNGFDEVSTEKDKEKRWLSIETKSSDGELTIKVRDGGKGIPKELANEIFQPFYTTKDSGDGAGLGLSICRGIIEKHDGKISYEIEEDDRYFLITLPR